MKTWIILFAATLALFFMSGLKCARRAVALFGIVLLLAILLAPKETALFLPEVETRDIPFQVHENSGDLGSKKSPVRIVLPERQEAAQGIKSPPALRAAVGAGAEDAFVDEDCRRSIVAVPIIRENLRACVIEKCAGQFDAFSGGDCFNSCKEEAQQLIESAGTSLEKCVAENPEKVCHAADEIVSACNSEEQCARLQRVYDTYCKKKQ